MTEYDLAGLGYMLMGTMQKMVVSFVVKPKGELSEQKAAEMWRSLLLLLPPDARTYLEARA